MASPIILNRQRKYRVPIQKLRGFAASLAKHLNVSSFDFTIVLTTDQRIQRLNRDFLSKDRPTDVLSFPAAEPQQLMPNFDNHYIGDIIISVETAKQQAFQKKHSLEKEIRTLIIHGLLHLLGYDHEADQGQMRLQELKLQRELL